MNRIFLCSLGATCALCLTQAKSLGDVVIDWNRIASDVLVADAEYQNPGMASRSLAMLNIAMYDAINLIAPRNQPFYTHSAAVPNTASVDAAAIQAGYEVLSNIYPSQLGILDAARMAGLQTLPEGTAKAAGITFGSEIGRGVVERRVIDGFNNMVTFAPTDEPGRWQPDPMNPTQKVWGPEWGELTTFAVSSTSLMMPPEMPSLDSQRYTDAFNEVKELGSLNSTSRTADQTEIGLFWAYDRSGMGTPLRMFNQILQTVANDQGNDLSDNAHLFALAATSMADAGIVAWDSKFKYDFWRPVTGIRAANDDGNPNTIADPDWIPLGAPGGIDDGEVINDFTPPFPTYVSGHASFGGALFQSLTEFYETDDISFQVMSEEVPGVVRSYESFSDALEELGRSRVYLGIHWDFDDLMGRETGKQVAEHVAANYFNAVPEPHSCVLFFLGAIAVLAQKRKRERP